MADGPIGGSTRTTCPYCGVGCGVLATPTGPDSALIDGDPQHPANFGRLCSKGSALGETLGRGGRLLTPYVDGERANWDVALDRVASGFAEAIRNHGPDSVAFYLSGQLLTEDYYVANKLMKGFIGSANVDTNSRLCMASAVVGHKRAFGTDTVPCTYEDLEKCDLLVLCGSNLAWCHPVLYQRIVAEKERRPELEIIVIDPRRTASCDLASQHLALAPGSDVALYLGLFKHLQDRGCTDTSFVSQHTQGLAAVSDAAKDYSIEKVAKLTKIDPQSLAQFYEVVAKTSRTVTVFSMGVNQASDGCDRVNAIINTHLLTGRIGKPGAAPFSMTGQPNAMGGREVGGLANQLAAHMDFDPSSVDRVGRFWNAPRVATAPGLKAVDMFEAVKNGSIKAIWIMGTNPVVSMPDADRVRAALEACPLTVVSDIVPNTDTARCADVLLPATGWGEKDGTVTNSERRLSRQKAFLPAPGLARHDWWQMVELAKRLGFGEAFSFEKPADIFKEHAELTAFENGGSRDLDLGGLAGLSDGSYDHLHPVQWPITEEGQQTERFFADGQFYTDNKKARFIAPQPPQQPAEAGPFVLNTGRIRDQWHTMTRTARAARLNQHIAEPFVDIHPDDARALGLKDAELATLRNERGEIVVRACLTDRQARGQVFVPMHWTGDLSSRGRVDSLVAPAPDPFSGQPALKSSTVTIEPTNPSWYGFAVGLAFETPRTLYWAKAPAARGMRMELADAERPADWAELARDLLGVEADAQVTEQNSGDGRSYRAAFFRSGRVVGVFLAGPRPIAAARDWLADQLGTLSVDGDRWSLLAGFPGEGVTDPGPTICSCMGVGRNTLLDAMRDGADTLNKLGACTGAGTNCGSCRPEIRKLMEEIHVPA